MTRADDHRQFLLTLIAIFAAAKLFGEIAERLGQPAVLGELTGGVLVGVSGLHVVNPHDVTIHLLSELGVIILHSALALMVMLTTLMTPLLLRALLPQAAAAPVHEEVDLVVDAPMDERRREERRRQSG